MLLNGETMPIKHFQAALASLLCLASAVVAAQEKVLNLYSARHYQTDEALYANFTKQTGIKINRIEGREDELLERIKNEGEKSPADVFLTVDAARLEIADQLGLFAPVKSKALEERIPDHLRTPTWFAFSTRARVIVYNKEGVKPQDVQSYADLADPKLKGKLCSRSGSHPYNLSLGSAMILHDGEAKTEAWARGVVANFARAPKGGDTDQIKAVAAGECQVAVSNTYYLVRLMRSDKPQDKKVVEKIGVVWPNQSTWGTHVNVSGGGMLKTAPNKDSAVKFLEYLASDEAQAYFANGNNEWPVVKSAVLKNPELDALGKFKPDTANIGQLARNTAAAQKIFDRAGYR
jgi:iron(III) transport system substrate-binding protein